MNRVITALSPLAQTARRSITFDRGFEFVSWRELDTGMGTKAWFCDPQAPWQNGSVENMNKRLRRYLPRDTALNARRSIYEVDLRASECNTAQLSWVQDPGGGVSTRTDRTGGPAATGSNDSPVQSEGNPHVNLERLRSSQGR